jgi:predicted RNA binding protein YcfA (HicA-like mRNA interferase family)
MSVEVSHDQKITLAHEEATGLWVATESEEGIAGQGDEPFAALENLYDALDGHNGEGRPPTDEELRQAGIDPEDNTSGGELPPVLQKGHTVPMVTRDFSGYEIVKVLVNAGNFKWKNTRGDDAVLEWNPPASHNTKKRTVTVPLHDRVAIGTLRSICRHAGGKDFDEFCAWIDRNR